MLGKRIESGRRREASSQVTNRPESHAEQVPAVASPAPSLDLDALERNNPFMTRTEHVLIAELRASRAFIQTVARQFTPIGLRARQFQAEMPVAPSSRFSGAPETASPQAENREDPNSTLIGGRAAANWRATPTQPKFRVGDLVRFKRGRIVWRVAKVHGRGISGELWKGPTAWNSRQAFFTEIELVTADNEV